MQHHLTHMRHERPDLWDRFSLEHEVSHQRLDEYGRARWTDSGISDPTEPVVSAWLAESGHAPQWPDGHGFALCLTHDIDVLHYSRKHKAWDAAISLIRGTLRNGPPLKRERFSARHLNPLWCFRDIIELEQRYSATSTFNFLALNPGDEDFNYRIPDLSEELNGIVSAGCEVALHGGHEAWKNRDALIREKERIEDILSEPVTGYRSHYLRFRVPDTWLLLRDAGFEYDSTLGWHDAVGFRNGMCHPFQPIDPATGEQIDILEIPLAVMDRTFDRYMELDEDDAWSAVRAMIDRVAVLNGVLTVLWHNTDFSGRRRELYERILSYGNERGAWLTNCRGIARWWRSM